MNILLVAQNYHPFIGGVETHARQVAQELSKRHKVTVVAGNFLPSRVPHRLSMLAYNLMTPAYASYQDSEVPIHSLTPSFLDRVRMLPIALRALPVIQRYAYHSLNRMGYPWFRWVYQKRLERLMKGADVVHSLAGGYLGWAAQDAARNRGLPLSVHRFAIPTSGEMGRKMLSTICGRRPSLGWFPPIRTIWNQLVCQGSDFKPLGFRPTCLPQATPRASATA